MKLSSRLRAVFIGGAIAGALDILFAITWAAVNGRTPAWLLQTIATGLLGKTAYESGLPAVIIGLAAHFALSFIWAAFFVAAAARLPRLLARPAFTGPAFGILVFFTMRLVVLPLSAFPYPASFSQPGATLDLLSHMFFFGLPIALAAAQADSTERKS
jgi:uncharacterized membrane protein YagU involved in acid resistance